MQSNNKSVNKIDDSNILNLFLKSLEDHSSPWSPEKTKQFIFILLSSYNLRNFFISTNQFSFEIVNQFVSEKKINDLVFLEDFLQTYLTNINNVQYKQVFLIKIDEKPSDKKFKLQYNIIPLFKSYAVICQLLSHPTDLTPIIITKISKLKSDVIQILSPNQFQKEDLVWLRNELKNYISYYPLEIQLLFNLNPELVVKPNEFQESDNLIRRLSLEEEKITQGLVTNNKLITSNNPNKEEKDLSSQLSVKPASLKSFDELLGKVSILEDKNSNQEQYNLFSDLEFKQLIQFSALIKKLRKKYGVAICNPINPHNSEYQNIIEYQDIIESWNNDISAIIQELEVLKDDTLSHLLFDLQHSYFPVKPLETEAEIIKYLKSIFSILKVNHLLHYLQGTQATTTIFRTQNIPYVDFDVVTECILKEQPDFFDLILKKLIEKNIAHKLIYKSEKSLLVELTFTTTQGTQYKIDWVIGEPNHKHYMPFAYGRLHIGDHDNISDGTVFYPTYLVPVRLFLFCEYNSKTCQLNAMNPTPPNNNNNYNSDTHPLYDSSIVAFCLRMFAKLANQHRPENDETLKAIVSNLTTSFKNNTIFVIKKKNNEEIKYYLNLSVLFDKKSVDICGLHVIFKTLKIFEIFGVNSQDEDLKNLERILNKLDSPRGATREVSGVISNANYLAILIALILSKQSTYPIENLVNFLVPFSKQSEVTLKVRYFTNATNNYSKCDRELIRWCLTERSSKWSTEFAFNSNRNHFHEAKNSPWDQYNYYNQPYQQRLEQYSYYQQHDDTNNQLNVASSTYYEPNRPYTNFQWNRVYRPQSLFHNNPNSRSNYTNQYHAFPRQRK